MKDKKPNDHSMNSQRLSCVIDVRRGRSFRCVPRDQKVRQNSQHLERSHGRRAVLRRFLRTQDHIGPLPARQTGMPFFLQARLQIVDRGKATKSQQLRAPY